MASQPVSISRAQAAQLGEQRDLIRVNPQLMQAFQQGRVSQHEKQPKKDCGCASTDKLEQRIKQLEQRLGKYAATGTYHPGDRNEYDTGGYTDTSLYKGGNGLWTGAQFPAATVAIGDSQDGTVRTEDEGRLRETELCYISAIVDDELAAVAEKFVVTVELNGVPLPQFRQVPLDEMIPTLDDVKQQAPFGFRWDASSSLVIKVECIDAVTSAFTAVQDVNFRVRGDAKCA